MPPSKRKLAGRANGLKARGKPEEHERRQVELAAKALAKAMAPKRTIEKKKKVDASGYFLLVSDHVALAPGGRVVVHRRQRR